MLTTVDLEPEAYRIAQAIATQQSRTVGEILSEAVVSQFRSVPVVIEKLEAGPDGFPLLFLNRPITSEEVATLIEEE
ncbi:hypothetical protein EON79_08615 [bacterium]|nr:MAG: hypothetical protein EON79_08615 [bacterium]